MPIEVNQKGICPHCKIPNRFETVEYRNNVRDVNFPIFNLRSGKDDHIKVLSSCRCTNCGEIIMFLGEQMIFPLGAKRTAAPNEVPKDIMQDFNEACLVESLSAKAAAALGRRCLQNMLRERGITPGNLSTEIDEAMQQLPTQLSESIDAIRNIGNFASHPTKSTQTGEIIEVEPGETEWLLDTLEDLFDYYYVAPAKTKAKKNALNKKLADAGKPPAK